MTPRVAVRVARTVALAPVALRAALVRSRPGAHAGALCVRLAGTVHAVAIQLAPIIGAEKSKVPFYIAGGALVLWAVILSLALGMRRPDFPGSAIGERAVIAITAVLVLAAAAMAVVTSGTPAKASVPAAASGGGAAEVGEASGGQ